MYKTVQELLNSPERWCQGFLAKRDMTKEETDNGRSDLAYPTATNAVKWDLIGAVHKVYPGSEHARVFDALEKVIGKDLIGFNDKKERTHDEVLDAVKKAGV